MASTPSFPSTWRQFLIELEFARNYPIAYQLEHGTAVRNPVLESILPSLLHIKMAALLDEALDSHLNSTGTALPKGYRSNLDGRISFCSDSGLVPDGPGLHGIRQMRNALAHEASSSVSWSQLDQDLVVVHSALQHLGVVGQRPRFEMNAERSGAQESQEPGFLFHFDYAVTLLENGKTAAKFTWRESVHNDETS